jgi:hypothetical protein
MSPPDLHSIERSFRKFGGPALNFFPVSEENWPEDLPAWMKINDEARLKKLTDWSEV